ncbi:MAG: Amuc_1100 family pilus-like protein [Verrucomicrobiae bacterium]|nr:Amuc_1100 family pilus-like protein [Verrucomicrobiae bacterium]
MPWIKKNLMLVLGGLVGLVLLGGSGFFLYSESSREADINAQLEEKQNEWGRLNNLNPFPEDRNIQLVREEAERMEQLALSLRSTLHPLPAPEVTDTFSLRLLIENTISELRGEAEAAGVELPDRYAFTFQRLRDHAGQFDSNAIPRIAQQVAHISTLCRVLFNAKVHALSTIRRSAVLREEGGTSDFLTKGPVTNNWVIRAPYDLSFRSFNSELAEVIRGLAALGPCIAIKTLNVEPTTIRPAGGMPMMVPPGMMPVTPGMAPPQPGGGIGGMDPALAERYGLGRGRGEGGGMDASMRDRYGIGGGRGRGGGMDPSMRDRYGIGGGGGGAGGMDPALRERYGIGPGAPGAGMAPGMPPMMAPPGGGRGPGGAIEERPLLVILQLDFVTPRPAPDTARRTPARAAAVRMPDGDGMGTAE